MTTLTLPIPPPSPLPVRIAEALARGRAALSETVRPPTPPPTAPDPAWAELERCVREDVGDELVPYLDWRRGEWRPGGTAHEVAVRLPGLAELRRRYVRSWAGKDNWDPAAFRDEFNPGVNLGTWMVLQPSGPPLFAGDLDRALAWAEIAATPGPTTPPGGDDVPTLLTRIDAGDQVLVAMATLGDAHAQVIDAVERLLRERDGEAGGSGLTPADLAALDSGE